MNWDLSNNWEQLIAQQISAQKFGQIQVGTMIFILIIAAILMGFFFLMKKYIVPYIGSRRDKKRAKLYLYRIEVVSWIAFTLFSIYQLMVDSIYITSALLIVIILAGINFWRDLFAGIAFRLENKFELRDPVKYENYSGTLDNISKRNISIKTDKEELVTIPFRKLTSAIFIKRQAKEKLHSTQLTLHLGTQSAEEVLPKIDQWIFECPWTIDNENANTKVIGGGLIQLTVYAVDNDSIRKTEEFLQQRIRK